MHIIESQVQGVSAGLQVDFGSRKGTLIILKDFSLIFMYTIGAMQFGFILYNMIKQKRNKNGLGPGLEALTGIG